MDPALDNPFWAFSLQVYGAPGVAEECLRLQERLGLDVNLLLLAAYLGAAEGLMLDAADLAAATNAVAAWHGETVQGLRKVRRALKPASLDESNPLRAAIVTLRAQVKAAELEAERIEQAMLWRWSQEHLAARKHADRRAALHSNLDEVLAHHGEHAGATDAELPHLQAAALVFAQSKP
jgi:uncharacterized protein (TIGR02444 family)